VSDMPTRNLPNLFPLIYPGFEVLCIVVVIVYVLMVSLSLPKIKQQ